MEAMGRASLFSVGHPGESAQPCCRRPSSSAPTTFSVAGCACDSRQVRPGDLFAALPGSQSDGHDFIRRGGRPRRSRRIVPSGRRPSRGVPSCVVPNARDAYGRICQALAGNPSFNLKLIGVTGTNGKTTTSCLIASILAKAGHRVGLLGTLGYFDGETVEPATHTTPPADLLAAWLARMVANGCSHAVMEVSSHALAQSRVAGVRFDAACVTNVSRDHLDYHPTIQDYRLAKSKLFDHLAPEGFAVINADDPVAAGYLRRFDGPALTVGIRRDAEITATPIEQFLSEQTFLLTAGSETMPVRTQMIGTHHIYNCLTAAAVGLAYGIDLPTVVRGLEAVEYVPGRLQRIECGQPFGVFVDFAHTPDALTGCLTALAAGDGGPADLRVRGRRRPRPAEAAADGPGRRERRRPGRRHQRQSPQRRPAGRSPTRSSKGFEHPGRRAGDPRSRDGHPLGARRRPGPAIACSSPAKGTRHYQIVGDQRIPLDDARSPRSWLYEEAETDTPLAASRYPLSNPNPIHSHATFTT